MDQQALVQSQTNVLQQETVLKSALSRNGLESPAVAEAHVIPTDHGIQNSRKTRISTWSKHDRTQLSKIVPTSRKAAFSSDNNKILITGYRNRGCCQPSARSSILRNNALSGSLEHRT